MKIIFKLNFFALGFVLFSCANTKENSSKIKIENTHYTIAFGSCNKQNQKNVLWQEIKKNEPNLWIWGGDNIYADTDNMSKLKADYAALSQQKGYAELVQNISVMATWDDHDYGFNDSGTEFPKKRESQQAFLDFFKVAENSPRRKQEGIYHSEVFKVKEGSIKVIVLDTRYFRTALTTSKTKKKRYEPNTTEEGSVLGEKQWKWLTNELYTSSADFNIIVSSIQFLSSEHGFETWGNFPKEVEKLKNTIVKSNAKGVLILSGDRHISEFSKTKIENLSFPLIDFTSSGLTHSYTNYLSEPNQYRVQNVIAEINFGLLKFDFKKHEIIMQMRGKENKLLQEFIQTYP
jgi:alkaline phosphatase D